MNNTPDISLKYRLPRYYIPASLQTTFYLFIYSNTGFEDAKKIVDSAVTSGNTIEAVKIFTETGSTIIEEIQTYCQEQIDLDPECIDVVKNLELLQIIGIMGLFQRDSAYREALYN